jgi:hypothetical protein
MSLTDIPKAYCPIALLNTIAKLLTSIIVEDIMYLVELHQLLPSTHFGGCPGHMTTNSLHLLTDTTKAAWQKEQVVSVLFLDIKGAFPNAVTNRLLHNMRKRRVPEQYVIFVENMLMHQRMKLKFDNFTLEWFQLDSGIGQGDRPVNAPYLFYIADMLDITKGINEKGLGYMDDKAVIMIPKTFSGLSCTIQNLRLRSQTWLTLHNPKQSNAPH